MFGQPSQPSLFGGGSIFGNPASQPAGNPLALAPFSQPALGQQLAAPGEQPRCEAGSICQLAE